jgi:hypothetical protein
MAQHASGPEIRIARSTDRGRTFAPSEVVDANSCPCCRTSLALAADGTVYVAWRKIFDAGVRDIVVARAGPGEAGFGEPVRVHGDDWVFDGCPHAGPSLATDGTGALHVGWYTGRADRQGLWRSVSQDGGASFSDPAPLLKADWVPASQVELRATGSHLLAGWEDRTVEGGAVVLGVAPSRSAGPPEPLFRAPGRLPALDGDGQHALFAWLDGETIRAVWTE